MQQQLSSTGGRTDGETAQSGTAAVGWSSWVSPSAYMESYRGGEPREKGTKRKKIAGYLSAANQVRQNYISGYLAPGGDQDPRYTDSEAGGAWTDADLKPRESEAMVLFPSYARRRVPEADIESRRKESPSQSRSSSRSRSLPGFRDGGRRSSADGMRSLPDVDLENIAVIDADVRGWIYQPHSGPLTYKNKILMGVARQICGLPAQGRGVTKEDQEVSSAAQKALEEGTFSDDESVRTISPSGSTTNVNALPQPGVVKRLSWKAAYAVAGGNYVTPPPVATPAASGLTPKELDTAHGFLKQRVTPFLHKPIPNIPVTIFFYNKDTSQSRTVTTNEYGHFSLRAGLPFVPEQVRVLASEKLNVTEEVRLLESDGISLISDIDVTIKHSAVAMGPREIFRNTFIRDLDGLTIPGVTELYNTLDLLGVPIHYVSNSPWQLFPMLQEYFKLANLPQGTFHLKQYSGMLQGIFEPVAERKKGNLERILKDFPSRQFILIGDSGEADLEVYTEVAMSYPGRIKAVFIRDVTTKEDAGFFGSNQNSQSNQRKESSSKPSEYRPKLPTRPATTATETPRLSTPIPSMEKLNLIDFSSSDDEGPQVLKPMKGVSMYNTTNNPKGEKAEITNTKPKPPPKPIKPVALRGNSLEGKEFPTKLSIRAVSDAPQRIDEHPMRSVGPVRSSSRQTAPPLPERAQTQMPTSSRPSLLSKSRLSSSNYSSPPSSRESTPPPSISESDHSITNGHDSHLPIRGDLMQQRQSRQPNLRRVVTAASTGQAAPPATEVYDPNSGMDKKEWLWNQRWERAKQVLEYQGVVLKSWRKGTDVLEIAVSIVEDSRQDTERKSRS